MTNQNHGWFLSSKERKPSTPEQKQKLGKQTLPNPYRIPIDDTPITSMLSMEFTSNQITHLKNNSCQRLEIILETSSISFPPNNTHCGGEASLQNNLPIELFF